MSNSAPKIAPREGIIDEVKAALGDAFLEAKDTVQEVSITVRREALVEVMTILRDQFQYQQLMEIAGVDYPGRDARFDVVYHLLSVTKHPRKIGRAAGRERVVQEVLTSEGAVA